MYNEVGFCDGFVGSIAGQTMANDVGLMSFIAHRADAIANGWFNVGSTPLAQQALHMPTYNANDFLSSIALGQRWSHMVKGY